MNELIAKISRMAEWLAIGYLKHRQRERELGLKKGKVIQDQVHKAIKQKTN